jgi:ectoine hydroxylase-related dioxygenase (phytanoyl-CoA dioxygenase family)
MGEELTTSASDLAAEVLEIGYTVARQALGLAAVEGVAAAFRDEFSAAKAAASSRLQRSHSGSGHFQYQPELDGRCGDVAVSFATPIFDILEAILGADFRLAYANSNVSFPGADMQNWHRDHGPLWTDELRTPPFLIVVNIPLCRHDAKAGPTEVIPASQYESEFGGLEDAPTVLNEMELGDVSFRDLRLWHRGVPNNSELPREMLSFVYKTSWFRWRDAPSLRHSQARHNEWDERVQKVVGPPIG